MSVRTRSTLFVFFMVASLIFCFVPAYAAGTGQVTGVVFYDSNGNGIREADEVGLPNVAIQIRDKATGGVAFNATVQTTQNGSYAFTALTAAVYTISQVNQPGYVSTTPSQLDLDVLDSVVTTYNFGNVIPIIVRGTIFNDLNADGVRGLGELGIQNTLVEVYDDLNTNGLIDSGEPLVGSGVSDAQGNYRVENLLPGFYVVKVRPPAGAGDSIESPQQLLSPFGSSIQEIKYGLTSLSVSGTVWNDADGDEIVDPGEPLLPNVEVWLIQDSNANGITDAGEVHFRQIVTDAAGFYKFSNILVVPQIVDVNPATVPAGWISSSATSASSFTPASPVEGIVRNIGFFDAFTATPMRLSDWKKEFRQSGRPRYSPQQLQGFVATAESMSALFPEVVDLRSTIERSVSGSEGKARKQYAALLLNVASKRLLKVTPINLPALTNALTVGMALGEIESLLAAPNSKNDDTYRRLEILCDSLNSGKGVGYGLAGFVRVARANYRGNDVTSALTASGGNIVDEYLNSPIYVTKFSPGALSPTFNVLRPRVHLKVQAFYNGAVLEVSQKLSDGTLRNMGTITPSYWNKDIRADYYLDLPLGSTVADLVSTQLQIIVRAGANAKNDPHVKVDAVDIQFDY